MALTQSGWTTCPQRVRAQVTALLDGLGTALGNDLVGVYLHGSLAMGCFTLQQGDIDLLVVTRTGLAVEIKRTVAELLLRRSGAPSPIEVSFLTTSQLAEWAHPSPFDYHYSERWRALHQAHLASGEWQRWNDPPPATRRDPDLAGHVAVTRERGLALVGPPAPQVLPAVPRGHVLASLLEEVEALVNRSASGAPQPGPPPSAGDSTNDVDGVLNACRFFAYVREGRLLSKDEGASWALRMLPAELQGAVASALDQYRASSPAGPLGSRVFAGFVAYARAEVRRLRVHGALP